MITLIWKGNIRGEKLLLAAEMWVDFFAHPIISFCGLNTLKHVFDSPVDKCSIVAILKSKPNVWSSASYQPWIFPEGYLEDAEEPCAQSCQQGLVSSKNKGAPSDLHGYTLKK